MSNKTIKTSIAKLLESEKLNKYNAYHLQFMIESFQSDTKLNEKIESEFYSSTVITKFHELLGKLLEAHSFDTRTQPVYDLVASATDVSEVVLMSILKVSYKEYISLGELQSSIKGTLVSEVGLDSSYLMEDTQLSLSLSQLALELVDLAEKLGCIQVTVYPKRELDDGTFSERKVRVETTIHLSIGLSKLCQEANDGLLPSLVPYRELTSNTSPLYIDEDIKCNVFNSVITKAGSVKAPLDHLNRVNSIKFYIDQSMIDDNCPAPVNMPRANRKYHKRRSLSIMTFYRFLRDNPFYIRHSLDGKFRTYCKSKFVNYQSVDWFKAAIDLGKYSVHTPKEVSDALKWSNINIANLMDFNHYEAGILDEDDLRAIGLDTISPDKQKYEARIELTKLYSNQDKLNKALEYMTLLAKKTKDHKLPTKQLEKAIKDHKKLINWDGINPVTIRSLIALDATSSFAQIGAIYSGNLTDAEHSNIIGENRNDIYTLVYQHMLKDNRLTLKKPLTRSIAKKLVMQTVYGSFAVRKKYLSKGVSSKQFKLNCEVLDSALQAIIPGTVRVIEYLRNSLKPNVTQYQWTMVDGCEARAINSTYSASHAHKKLSIKSAHTWNGKSYTETSEVHRYLKGKKSIGLIALMVQSLDAFLVREVTARCKDHGFDIVTIHDSYACQYKYANDLVRIYKEVVIELSNVNLLDFYSGQLGSKPFKQDKSLALAYQHGLGDSTYHLC